MCLVGFFCFCCCFFEKHKRRKPILWQSLITFENIVPQALKGKEIQENLYINEFLLFSSYPLVINHFSVSRCWALGQVLHMCHLWASHGIKGVNRGSPVKGKVHCRKLRLFVLKAEAGRILSSQKSHNVPLGAWLGCQTHLLLLPVVGKD